MNFCNIFLGILLHCRLCGRSTQDMVWWCYEWCNNNNFKVQSSWGVRSHGKLLIVWRHSFLFFEDTFYIAITLCCTVHYGKKCSKIGKNLTNFKKVSDPNLGHLEWFQRWLCLKITFGMLFFIVWAIENKKNPKKVHSSIFDFSWYQHLPPWNRYLTFT